ncbi:TMEM175 family protein [Gordonia sp. PP30]|uniref:TMEM175 family protein n=1 Tax=Gordonia sp. PP30 TaxID=2935861 RepID=UPI001FFFFEE3|nr:TMEM175 family protein [Gordonia sp. PP30]UQE75658.1 TMEM175 family protein [Gordonia sp. PP30]
MADDAGDVQRTIEGWRRLVAFSDAVVAIALTLLVLPLTDAAGDTEAASAWDFLDDHSALVISVLISFAVIAWFWWHHHRMAEYFERYDGVTVFLHLLWLLMIVLLPFSTELGSARPVAGSNVLYVVILTIASASLSAIYAWGRHHPGLLVEGDARRRFVANRGGGITVAVMVIALVVTILVPGSGSWPLLLLLAVGPLEKVLNHTR